MPIKPGNARNVFLGIHVTQEVREKIDQIADRMSESLGRHVFTSWLVNEWIHAVVDGYPLVYAIEQCPYAAWAAREGKVCGCRVCQANLVKDGE